MALDALALYQKNANYKVLNLLKKSNQFELAVEVVYVAFYAATTRWRRGHRASKKS